MANLAHVVSSCLKDPALKAKLLANPAAVLTEHGIKIPAGMTVKVHENSASVFHLVLPNTTASAGNPSADERAAAAGGWDPFDSTTHTTGCCGRAG
ncbi:MAG: NHLP leader peptide family RiPP precursor [Phycisphaerales bacterium]